MELTNTHIGIHAHTPETSTHSHTKEPLHQANIYLKKTTTTITKKERKKTDIVKHTQSQTHITKNAFNHTNRASIFPLPHFWYTLYTGARYT